MPRSRLYSVLVGEVRSMARSVSVRSSKVGGCPVFGRPGSGGSGYGTSGYRVHLGRENIPDPRFEDRRVAHDPNTLHAGGEEVAFVGPTERPDVPRRNPRHSRREGCQSAEGVTQVHSQRPTFNITQILLKKMDIVYLPSGVSIVPKKWQFQARSLSREEVATVHPPGSSQKICSHQGRKRRD